MFDEWAGEPGELMRLRITWGKGVFDWILSDSILRARGHYRKRGITDEYFNFRMGIFC